jgi:hypothetical protein
MKKNISLIKFIGGAQEVNSATPDTQCGVKIWARHISKLGNSSSAIPFTGVLISSDLVITAQHCCDGPTSELFVGKFDELFDASNSIKVNKVHTMAGEVFEDFSKISTKSPSEGFLSEPLLAMRLSNPLSGIKLPLINSDSVKPDSELIAIGLGKLPSESEALRSGSCSFIESGDWEGLQYIKISLNEITQKSNLAFISGDSGGPLLELVNGSIFLRGIQAARDKIDNKIGYFSALNEGHITWIKKLIGEKA